MVQHFINTRITFDSVQMFLFSLRMIYIISATKQRHFIHANKAHTIKIVLTFQCRTVSHRLSKPASPCDKDRIFLLICKLLRIYQLKTCNYLPSKGIQLPYFRCWPQKPNLYFILIMKPHFSEVHLSYSQPLLGQNLSSYTIGALSCEEDEREIRLQHVIIASRSLPARPSVPVLFLKGLMPLKLMQFLAITFQKTNKQKTHTTTTKQNLQFFLK